MKADDAAHADASHSDASRADASRADGNHADASRADASRADASRADASRADASRADGNHADGNHADAAVGADRSPSGPPSTEDAPTIDLDVPSGARRASRKAERIAGDKDRVHALMADAMSKASASRERLGDAWQQLQTLFRLVKAWVGGQYRDVPWRVIVLSLTALVYFVNPFDLIPDFLAFGFLDDIGVIGFLFSKMREDLDAFRTWESAQGATIPAAVG